VLRNIFLKTLRDNRWGILAVGLGLGLVLLVTITSYPALFTGSAAERARQSAEFMQLLKAFSALLGEPVPIDTLGGFLTFRSLGFLPVVIGVWAAIVAAGLIQAIMHQPRLLILDEPTSGLDPLNQQEFFTILSEARKGGATVFLSSHVLSEVEHTCDRVGIIREGLLERVGAVRDIVSEKQYRVELQFGAPVDGTVRQAFAELPGVQNLAAQDGRLQFVVQGALDPVIKLAAQYPVLSLTSHEPTLEEAFLTYYRGNGASKEPVPKKEAGGVA
jgi:hypothetical protein